MGREPGLTLDTESSVGSVGVLSLGRVGVGGPVEGGRVVKGDIPSQSLAGEQPGREQGREREVLTQNRESLPPGVGVTRVPSPTYGGVHGRGRVLPHRLQTR